MKNIMYILAVMLPTILLFTGCMKEDIDELRKNQEENASRITALEEWQKQVNSQIVALQGLVNALEANDYVTGVTQFDTPAPGGYRITFTKSGEATIWNGAKGESPVIGVREDVDGKHYWTLDGEWLLEGNGKIPATGDKGDRGYTPRVIIGSDGLWYVSADGSASGTPPAGTGWSSTGVKATGDKGEQGDAIFAKDGIDLSNADRVEFTLSDGTVIALPRYVAAVMTFGNVTDNIYDTEIEPNKTYHVPYTIAGDKAESIIIVKAETEAMGIDVSVTKTGATTGTIDIATATAINTSSVITVMISDGNGYLSMYAFTLEAVPTVVPESNSYMLEPYGGAILIPVSRANAVLDAGQNQGAETTGLGGITADNYTVELVWSDTPIGNSGVIRSMSSRKVADNGYVYIKPGRTGNAVVCIKVDNTVKWSWHIWVTEKVGTATDAVTGLTWMDRNLGATANTPFANHVFDRDKWTKTIGLYYQWGRKDAFPGSNGSTESRNPNQTYYTSEGEVMGTITLPTASYTTLSEMTQNPLTFAVNTTTYEGSAGGIWPNYSWQDAANKKTIYDPCPPGWKVPEKTIKTTRSINVWGGISDNSWAPDLSGDSKGRIFNGVQGTVNLNHFYPANGSRTSNAEGGIMSIGTSGNYWTAIPDSPLPGSYMSVPALNLYFITSSQYGVYPDNKSFRSSGYGIRCVKE